MIFHFILHCIESWIVHPKVFFVSSPPADALYNSPCYTATPDPADPPFIEPPIRCGGPGAHQPPRSIPFII